MWEFSRRGWYWVRTPTVSTPELMQLESGKSMMRYFPPNATAGFAILDVSTPSRLPCPPARSMAIISFFTIVVTSVFVRYSAHGIRSWHNVLLCQYYIIRPDKMEYLMSKYLFFIFLFVLKINIFLV